MIYIRLMNTITHERSNYPQKMAGDSFFHLCTSERTHAAAPPFSQKVTFGSSVRTQTPSRRLTAASSCGARLWLRRINRLANRRPPCQQILAVSCTAGARMCCKLFASSRVQLSPTNAENLFFMWLSQKRSHYILYDIVVFYCFMLICRAAFMAALCYCFV